MSDCTLVLCREDFGFRDAAADLQETYFSDAEQAQGQSIPATSTGGGFCDSIVGRDMLPNGDNVGSEGAEDLKPSRVHLDFPHC